MTGVRRMNVSLGAVEAPGYGQTSHLTLRTWTTTSERRVDIRLRLQEVDLWHLADAIHALIRNMKTEHERHVSYLAKRLPEGK